ncbi:MAG: hypothetical protein UW93_C0011G0015 [Parcubacteria group bacterium GW2011_GWC1_45_13]|uniref:Uncharacterized protein n=2 Tax=Candidatus Giovannoniibacteriota TaxID=1752738 RepID=A0A0G1IYC9_9BACT|nr:MAG: hypothetical protein UW49_C0004G0109 [Candidatus Giovannonibacteria bacterium GW2011_GWB1_44_23]KKT63998.1 MAG: hypothetical protein UW57_C0004G0108 [Candidatus Giovannonibacteria bacterium GW2011_GWA1_44_29]KKT91191.1 MAG: hypothetical protein UW93_C0011G0015 [Parcubacteria group bacterium GW2011_GWC1_45_13]
MFPICPQVRQLADEWLQIAIPRVILMTLREEDLPAGRQAGVVPRRQATE